MSYEKNTWASGDVITAEKLNHLEDGVAGGGSGGGALYINFTVAQDMSVTADKTFAEIADAFNNGLVLVGLADIGVGTMAFQLHNVYYDGDNIVGFAFGHHSLDQSSVMSVYLEYGIEINANGENDHIWMTGGVFAPQDGE